MAEGRLYIGNRRYSSWSMRGWLAVKLAGLDVEEVMIHFSPSRPDRGDHASFRPTAWCRISSIAARACGSRSRCASTCAEIAPSLWPADPVARAHARAISAEMHAGFTGMRQSMWMNLGRDFSGLGRTPEALADIARIEAMWADTRQRFGAGGPFLFGAAFTAADAMYAPVVTRFLTWRPEIAARDASLLRCGACTSAGERDGTMVLPRSPRNGCCPTTKTPGERHRTGPRRCRHARSCRAGRAVRAPWVHADAACPPGRRPDRQSLRDAAWVVYGASRSGRSERGQRHAGSFPGSAMPASTSWRSPSTIRSPRSRGCGAPASRLPSVSHFDRPIDDMDPAGPRARFALIQTARPA